MKIQPASWFSLLIFVCMYASISMHYVWAQCLDDQKSLLLEFRSRLKFKHSESTKLVQWNQTIDCCQWRGVKCNHSNGQVIGLDLSNEAIWGGIDNSSSLFHMQFLRSLNLAYNSLHGKVPSAISKLTSLTYLNISLAGFSGAIPSGLSQLVKLVILDLSTPPDILILPVYMDSQSFANLVWNLTHIEELYLDGVSILGKVSDWIKELYLDGVFIPGKGSEWSKAFSSPHLRVLSLSSCSITGDFPRQVFKLPALRTLDLSGNFELQGTLPEFPQNGSLQTLVLSDTKFSGPLSNSIGNLKRLQKIDLSSCNFSGVIPTSISTLNLLEYLDLSGNKFSGSVPSFSSAKNLKHLALADNSLNGSITSTDWGRLTNLALLDLSNNSIADAIPMSLFSAPSLQRLCLAQNKFSGKLHEFVSISSSMLKTLDLGNNFLEGPVPKTIFQLKGLEFLDLSWNRLEGTLELGEILHQLNNLTHIGLSYNAFSVHTNSTTARISFPQLSTLLLASCKLHVLPELLKSQVSLEYLDVSNNLIEGTVPKWIWKVGNGYLHILNLSCNSFVDLEQPLPDTPLTITTLDLHSNNLQGQLPAIPSPLFVYLDYSGNNYTSISPHIGNSLSKTIFLSLSRNNIKGNIPTSLCNASTLVVLDLKYNKLNGTIPNCLIAMTKSLGVLNLRGNNLGGAIPDNFGKSCVTETLDFNGNFLKGRIPRSLANCKMLRVLDLGNNQLNGTFPCHLKSFTQLQVIILRSNNFHGSINCQKINLIWPLLQILDLATNHFTGELKAQFLPKSRMMMAKTGVIKSEPSHLQYHVSTLGNLYYKDAVAVTLKGFSYELQNILIIFTSIDLSNNAFHGEIPRELGRLHALIGLNLSHNSLSGNIPSSFGNLSQLESLDLSYNILSGNIPPVLANLNFLEYLDLSFNKLVGSIPTGPQLQLFDASSYKGNQGLYGPPLTFSFKDRPAPELMPSTSRETSYWTSKSKHEWVMRGAEVGLPVGFIIFIGPLLRVYKIKLMDHDHGCVRLCRCLREAENTKLPTAKRREEQDLVCGSA